MVYARLFPQIYGIFYASSFLQPTLLMYFVCVKTKMTFHRESARSDGNLREWCLIFLLKDLNKQCTTYIQSYS